MIAGTNGGIPLRAAIILAAYDIDTILDSGLKLVEMSSVNGVVVHSLHLPRGGRLRRTGGAVRGLWLGADQHVIVGDQIRLDHG